MSPNLTPFCMVICIFFVNVLTAIGYIHMYTNENLLIDPKSSSMYVYYVTKSNTIFSACRGGDLLGGCTA